MNKNKIWLLFAMIAIVGVAVISCPPPDDEEEEVKVLGSISIAATTVVIPGEAGINDQLKATYGGTETVTYQWKKDGTVINSATNDTYTPTVKGVYKVTISASGFPDKDSNSITVNGNSKFFGTWTANYNQAKISANKIEVSEREEITDTTFSKIYVNEDFVWETITGPTGYTAYKITGKLSFKDGFAPPKSDDTEPDVGDTCVDHWAISSDFATLIFGLYNSGTLEFYIDADGKFTK